MMPDGESTPVFVRTASKQDLEPVRTLLRQTFHDTYDGLFGAERVEALLAEWHSLEALTRQLSAPRSEFVVADTGSEIVGVASAIQEGRAVKLQQLYVVPQAQGAGVGLSLLQEIFFCFDDADTFWLEVHPENRKAIDFYARQGFAEKGPTSCRQHEDIPAIRMELNPQEIAG
ncbi:MAG: GNAT family N-acetyltransferase [Thiothrix sp.]|nr:GNAT family N-acetyltransferase [Thiothrix sp.]